jgi:hypothetical protein
VFAQLRQDVLTQKARAAGDHDAPVSPKLGTIRPSIVFH